MRVWTRVDTERSRTIVYDPNANWTARTDAAAKSPVYAVRFDGIDATTLYTTGPVRNPTSTIKVYLNTPKSVAQKLSQLKGRASMSLFSFDLVDKDDEITTLVLSNNLINEKVTLLSGYADLDEADYAPYPIGQIKDVSIDKESRIWRFKLVDLKRAQLEEAFSNAGAATGDQFTTKLSEAVSQPTIIFKIFTPNDLPGQFDRLFLGPSTAAGFIGNEEVAVVLKTNDEGNGITRIVTEADLQNDYSVLDPVRRASVVLEGNPINIMFSVLTGDFAHASFPLAVAEGIPTGLGIDPNNIDQASLISERDTFYGDEVWRFEIKNPIKGFRFLEQKIYRFLGFPLTTPDGKLSFKMYGPPRSDVAAAGLPQLTESHILSWKWMEDHSLHVNKVSVALDSNTFTGRSVEFVTIEDAADQAATEETAEIKEIDSGFNSALRGRRLIDERGRALLRLFLKPPEILVVDATMTKRALELGEVVEVTHSKIPDRDAGLRGLVRERFMMVQRKEEFDRAKLEFKLQRQNYTRPAWWAPDSAPDYSAASDADKERAYFAPDAGNFADGKPPYEWV